VGTVVTFHGHPLLVTIWGEQRDFLIFNMALLQPPGVLVLFRNETNIQNTILVRHRTKLFYIQIGSLSQSIISHPHSPPYTLCHPRYRVTRKVGHTSNIRPATASTSTTTSPVRLELPLHDCCSRTMLRGKYGVGTDSQECRML
jgi:hypothetical protein